MTTKQCYGEIVVPAKLEKCCLNAMMGIFVTEVYSLPFSKCSLRVTTFGCRSCSKNL